MMDRWSICEYRNLNHSSREVWATVEFRITEGSAREESAGGEVLTEAEALIARRGARRVYRWRRIRYWPSASVRARLSIS
ncbi:MAG: hypothetical protein K0S36_1763 [Nitrosospira multiformis]|jgi:hypothetical protein|nr:hypothetical protein [Nitrosospira multiformis]